MEGQTFRSPQLSAVLRDKVVESRLHMDFPGRIDPEKFPMTDDRNSCKWCQFRSICWPAGLDPA